ncbi:MAG: oligosaccharide flippase family protein [Saprospiraceae bacterium]
MSLARKASIFTVSRAVTIVAQIAALAILTRSLPKEIFAQLHYLLLLYGTAQIFGQFGIPDSIFYFFEKYPPEKRKSIAQYIAKILMWTALGSAGLLLIIGWFGTMDHGYQDARPLLWLFMALVVLELPTIPVPNILIALDKAKAAAWFNIFVGVTQFLAMTLPLLMSDTLHWIAVGLVLYGLLRMLLSAFIFYKNFSLDVVVPLPERFLQELLYYSIPLSLAQLFWTLNRQVDKYVVKEFLSPDTYAEYSNGAWELPIIPTIAYSIAAVMMPKMVSHFLKGETAPLLELWLTSIEKVTVIVLPLVMVFLLTSEEFMVMLYGEDYKNSAIPFFIYTFILLQRVASYSNMQKALNSTKEITYGAIYLFSINAALVIPFVLWWGVAGPPLASVVAQTFSWWYALNVIRKLMGVKFKEVFPFRFYGKTLLVAAAAALPFYFLKQTWDLPAGVAFGVLAISYLLTYLLLARMANVIAKEDVKRIFGKKK